MTDMRSPILVVMGALMIVLSSCTGKVRSRICNPNEFEFPVGADGHYRISAMSQDPRYSDSQVGLTEQDFWIKESPNTYEIIVPRTLSNIPSVSRLFSASSKEESGDGAPIPVMPFSVCKIGNYHYTEADNSDGTWSISRFDLSSTGISQVGLTFKPEELRAAGFSYRFLPKVEPSQKGGQWTNTGLFGGEMIVDTPSLNREDRERLLSIAHPSGLGIVFSRIADKTAPEAGGKYKTVSLPRGQMH